MRNVRRSEGFEDMVRQLAEKPHADLGRTILPTLRELMCFAAILGFEHEKKHALAKKTVEIDGRTFQNSEQATDVMCLIALCDTRSNEILRDDKEDDMVSIFEQYAQGGFEILASWLNERADDVNGDEAILAALRKYKFLDACPAPDHAIETVEF